MPIAHVRGVNINYEVLGSAGPWVALSPGGRRALDNVKALAQHVADAGYRVLIHDRRNCGLSDIAIGAELSEYEVWGEDLHELLSQLKALPAVLGGGSSGCRLSVLFALKYPHAVRALLLWRVTGGAFAAARLPENYYGAFIRAAEDGGMTAVCATEQYRERIAANPDTRDRLMKMDPKEYIKVMSNWQRQFIESTRLEVFGMTEADLASIGVPTVLIPGNDRTHASESGRIAARAIPGCVLHQLPIEDQDVPIIPYTDWAPYEDEIARVFVDTMRRAG